MREIDYTRIDFIDPSNGSKRQEWKNDEEFNEQNRCPFCVKKVDLT